MIYCFPPELEKDSLKIHCMCMYLCVCVRVCVCVRERGRDYALTSLISQGLELEKDSKAIVRLDLHGVLRERERVSFE